MMVRLCGCAFWSEPKIFAYGINHIIVRYCQSEFMAHAVLNQSLVVRKPAFRVCESKDADQLGSNCAADQRLCFRYTDNTIPLLPKSEISSL